MNNCIFCKISSGEVGSEIIYQNENFFSIYDINPLTQGHALVISKKHFETSLDLPNSLGSEFFDCIKETALIVMKKTQAEGFNLVCNNKSVASQIVPHFHFHIIPRKKGDGFKILH